MYHPHSDEIVLMTMGMRRWRLRWPPRYDVPNLSPPPAGEEWGGARQTGAWPEVRLTC